MNLYELKTNYLKLQELIENGELTKEDLQDTISMIDDSIELKAENYAKIIKMQEGNVNVLKEEIERLKLKQTSIQTNVDKLKENLKETMIQLNKDKIKTDLFSITVANVKPSVKIIDTTFIPDEYCITEITTKYDKIALKKAIDNGEFIAGVELERGKGLRIK